MRRPGGRNPRKPGPAAPDSFGPAAAPAAGRGGSLAATCGADPRCLPEDRRAAFLFRAEPLVGAPPVILVYRFRPVGREIGEPLPASLLDSSCDFGEIDRRRLSERRWAR